MTRFKAVAALSVCWAGAVTPLAAAAPIARTTMFQALGGNVGCGIEIHPSSAPAREVICSARGIPAPPGRGTGDPGFVQLAAAGAPARLRTSQDSFVPGSSATLGRGRTWSRLGVTCQVARTTVLCFNGDNHGFVIGNGHYRSF